MIDYMEFDEAVGSSRSRIQDLVRGREWPRGSQKNMLTDRQEPHMLAHTTAKQYMDPEAPLGLSIFFLAGA
jgi:hypothetical protein